jgi:hypothetical protein
MTPEDTCEMGRMCSDWTVLERDLRDLSQPSFALGEETEA